MTTARIDVTLAGDTATINALHRSLRDAMFVMEPVVVEVKAPHVRAGERFRVQVEDVVEEEDET